jgi:hypothetical protein
MSVFALVSGYEGCGKTTLCVKFQASFGHLLCFKDVDEFLVPAGSFRANLDAFLSDCTIPVVLFGSFSCSGSLGSLGHSHEAEHSAEHGAEPIEPYFPVARHYLWLDVSAAESTRRALKQQVQALQRTGASLYDHLMGQSPEEAQGWLFWHLNPHTRLQEARDQRRACAALFRDVSVHELCALMHQEVTRLRLERSRVDSVERLGQIRDR